MLNEAVRISFAVWHYHAGKRGNAMIGALVTASHSEEGKEIVVVNFSRYAIRKARRYGVMHLRARSGIEIVEVIMLEVAGQVMETGEETVIWTGKSRALERDTIFS